MKQRKYQKIWVFKYRLKQALGIQISSDQYGIKGSMKLHETEGIAEYHRRFELLRTDFKLPEDNLVCALERANCVWKPGRLLCSFIQLGWLVRGEKIHENAFLSEDTRERKDMDLCFFQSHMLKNTHIVVFRVDESAAGQIERSDIDDEKFWDTQFEEAQIRLYFMERSDTTKPVYPTEELISEHQLLVQSFLRVRREYQQ
ncbi:hypothetical protein Bca4012_025817 [Brassica carinata]